MLLDTPPWEWPPEAAPTIRSFLMDGRNSVDDRMAAAELGGDLAVMDDSMADALLSIVRSDDEPVELRARAAIALGPTLEQADIEGYDEDDPIAEPPVALEVFRRIQEILRRLYADRSAPKELRRRALEASVRAESEWHREAIAAAYAERDEDWRLTAVFGMRYVPGFDSQILEALENPNQEIHVEAIRSAGGRGLDEAWPHVAALLKSPETGKDLLLEAIGAAAHLRPAEAIPILDELAASEDEEIAEAAAEARDEAIMFEGLEEEAED
jgi:uncharacterized protein (UPF0147 family)